MKNVFVVMTLDVPEDIDATELVVKWMMSLSRKDQNRLPIWDMTIMSSIPDTETIQESMEYAQEAKHNTTLHDILSWKNNNEDT